MPSSRAPPAAAFTSGHRAEALSASSEFGWVVCLSALQLTEYKHLILLPPWLQESRPCKWCALLIRCGQGSDDGLLRGTDMLGRHV